MVLIQQPTQTLEKKCNNMIKNMCHLWSILQGVQAGYLTVPYIRHIKISQSYPRNEVDIFHTLKLTT